MLIRWSDPFGLTDQLLWTTKQINPRNEISLFIIDQQQGKQVIYKRSGNLIPIVILGYEQIIYSNLQLQNDETSGTSGSNRSQYSQWFDEIHSLAYVSGWAAQGENQAYEVAWDFAQGWDFEAQAQACWVRTI